MTLTETDKHTIADAWELASLSADAVEQRGPHYVVGQAQDIIKQLLATIDRLTTE